MKGIAFIFLCLGFIISCKNDRGEGKNHRHELGAEQTDSVYYTCPMHPSVISDKPGSCPVCGMDLVKKKAEKKAMEDHSEMLHLDDYRQWLANIKTDTARIKVISSYNTITGTAAVNENLVKKVTARASGRIEKLFVKDPGAKIQRGAEIMQLYSEQLLADENDYLHLLKQKEQSGNQSEFIENMRRSAKQKLLWWGLTEGQIRSIAETGTVSPYISFFSDVVGYLSQINVREGQYVNEGDVLFAIADIKKIWVEGQLYAGENMLLKDLSEAHVSFDAFPGEKFTGEIAYSNPAIEGNSKINLVRISIQNNQEKIKPGMMAYIHFVQKGKSALVIPGSALLAEKMKIVWVQTKPGMYERRMVQTGVENKYEIEIISGISEGELVVSSGAYLLNSEFVLKKGGAVKHQH